MDDGIGTPPALPPPPPSRQPNPLPVREDCWSEEATRTLIDAWGDRYLDLNRGNLRQKHWQEVAEEVNARHGHVKKARRSDIQCKNRIDTLKKKYKIEKARVMEADGTLSSPWPFFSALDALIGSSVPAKKTSPPVNRRASLFHPFPPPSSVPVGPRSKRSAQVEDAFSRRRMSAVAAAAAAMEAAKAEGSGSESSRSSWKNWGQDKIVEKDWQKEGCRGLSRAIERFGEIYERVEEAKQRQMAELEKERMVFAKDLEFRWMQVYVDTQIELQKIKRSKPSARAADSYV